MLRELMGLKGQVGELEADMRTTKHGVDNIQQQLRSIHSILERNAINRAKGLGFYAGITAAWTAAAGALAAAYKLLFDG